MVLESKRTELTGLVGTIGVAVAVAGFVGGFFPATTTVVACFSTCVVGTLLVRGFKDPLRAS
ncbi:MAG: hypothetical protein HKN30_00700 [Sulfitobacter sp.]|nr:hypothetical protein [Sulfitobacter sp.]